MRIKHQLAIFNALTRLGIVAILWLTLPYLVQTVVYRNINNNLLEKKQKFISHLDKEEINDFITGEDSTYASFSTLHNSFVQLSRLPEPSRLQKTVFVNEPRIIEEEESEYRILQYYFDYENSKYMLEIGSSLTEIKDLIFIIRIFILGVLLIIIMVTFLADTFYIEYLLQPFYKIIDTKIRRVDEPETFDQTPIVSHSSDFAELDSVLNQMMDRMNAAFKNEKQFIANVSHELLTPVSLLKNRFENLIQDETLGDAAVDKIAASLRTLDRLQKIINNLLLISKIENNQFHASETIDITEMLEELVEEIDDRLVEKEIRLRFDMLEKFIFIGNATLLHILLYNLIANAIKYNKQNGEIRISDSYRGANYVLSIADTGIGMDAARLTDIFKRFTRLRLEGDGQGLGLAIVKSIADFHKIRIEVTSVQEKSSTFNLIFPSKN